MATNVRFVRGAGKTRRIQAQEEKLLPRDGSVRRDRDSLSISLKSGPSRWGFALFILLIAGGFCWEAARVWIAEEFGASAKPELWPRAAQWEPDNAAYWAQLGSMEAWDLERGDLEKAAKDYERAVAANPYSDRNWLELAGIYERRGETSRARSTYEKAQFCHPLSPKVAWRYGNFLLRQGDSSAACRQFRKALQADPELTEDAVAEWWKAGLYTTQPLATLLPGDNRYYFKALNYFSQQHEMDAAFGTWDEFLRLGQPFELSQMLFLIDEAVSAGRERDAQRVWRQALEATKWPQDKNDKGSLVFNGGFEHKPADGGFDWRELTIAGAAYALDTSVVHSGTQSLRVSFDGTANVDFAHLLQYVPVEPSRRYRFSAYLRLEGITTDSGVRFWIYDRFRPAQVQTLIANLTGTNPWTEVSADITAGADTDLLVIALRRIPSWKFDNKLRGTVWVDDVSLVPVSAAAKGDLK